MSGGAFVAGILVGTAVGFLVSSFTLPSVAGVPVGVIAAGLVLVSAAAGFVAGRAAARPECRVRTSGRVFDFPQGPAMVELALKRAGSLVPAKPTRSD